VLQSVQSLVGGILMTTLSIENLREHLDLLESLLNAGEGVLVARNGAPFARIMPIGERRPIPSHEELRNLTPFQTIPSEVMVREDRDAR